MQTEATPQNRWSPITHSRELESLNTCWNKVLTATYKLQMHQQARCLPVIQVSGGRMHGAM